MSPSHWPVNSKEYQEREQATFDVLPCLTRCVCGWEFSGTALEGRVAAVEHRRSAHPDWKIKKKRMTRHLSSFRMPTVTEEQLDEIQRERERRAFLNGVDLLD